MKYIFKSFYELLVSVIDKFKQLSLLKRIGLCLMSLLFIILTVVFSLIQCNLSTVSAETVNNGAFVNNGVIKFNLGNVAQHRVVTGSPSVRYVSSALPTVLTIDASSNVTTDVDFTISIGSVDASITSSSYNRLFSDYSFSYNGISGDSGNLDWVNTSAIISIEDTSYTLDYINLFQYSGALNYPVSSESEFGFYYPTDVYFTTEGANGTWYGTKPTEGYTYFIMGSLDNSVNPTRVVKYNIQTLVLGNVTFGDGLGLKDTTFLLHSFLCDNGGLYFYGYNTYYNVPSTNIPYQLNYTYDFSSGDYDIGFEDGYTVGYNTGYSDGFNDGNNEDNEFVYNQGYENGYLAGSQVALEDVNPFNAVLKFVDSLMNARLFGSITIGNILMIVFGFVMVGIVVKVFLGG